MTSVEAKNMVYFETFICQAYFESIESHFFRTHHFVNLFSSTMNFLNLNIVIVFEISSKSTVFENSTWKNLDPFLEHGKEHWLQKGITIRNERKIRNIGIGHAAQSDLSNVWRTMLKWAKKRVIFSGTSGRRDEFQSDGINRRDRCEDGRAWWRRGTCREEYREEELEDKWSTEERMEIDSQ